MANVNLPPKTIGEIMDDIERIREELLVVQSAPEKLEGVRPVALYQQFPSDQSRAVRYCVDLRLLVTIQKGAYGWSPFAEIPEG